MRHSEKVLRKKPTALLLFSNVNKGINKINKCKEVKSKLNVMASIAMIYMVIKKKKKDKNLLGNGTQVGRTISKNTTT
jgi:hypothetical protein